MNIGEDTESYEFEPLDVPVEAPVEEPAPVVEPVCEPESART
jgi:hypothetical protein